ncbi:MAG: twin-arginine translocation pathway signal protein [Leptothrix sp. (in: Bacteria)]|nr:twin-arginine translocation pathway signal protein [Leptothrix sp. (in: b-proteobacteria)]
MKPHTVHRRHLLRSCARAAALALPGWPAAGWAANPVPPVAAQAAERSLTFKHLHTRERLTLVYAEADAYRTPALQALNHLLRDHYTGDAGTMDPALFDLLHRVQASLGGRTAGQACYEVISGYRCPATNQHLRQARGGGVASRSLHMDGRAIDVRLAGVPLAELRDAALAQKSGGVGYYPRDGFVHLDTGRTRHW